MKQMQFDFDMRLIKPNGRTVRFPSELVCMTRDKHWDFLMRRYNKNWSTICTMYELAKHVNRYRRVTSRLPA
jgi:hypothetical protein